MPLRVTKGEFGKLVRRMAVNCRPRRPAKRPRSHIAFDPKTREIRHGDVRQDALGLVLRIPLLLPSPNEWVSKGHWFQYRERKRWQLALEVLIAEAVGRRSASGLDPKCRLLGLEPCTEPRQVVIRRLVGRAGHLCRDTDNLAFTSKFLVDHLVKFGFLKDDDTKWTSRRVEQRVSEDGLPWTVIEIGPWNGVITPETTPTH